MDDLFLVLQKVALRLRVTEAEVLALYFDKDRILLMYSELKASANFERMEKGADSGLISAPKSEKIYSG